MNTLRFGKVVEIPEKADLTSIQVGISDELGREMETAIIDGNPSRLEAAMGQLAPESNLEHAPTASGCSLLHTAAEGGYVKCLGLLLDRGGMDVKLRDHEGMQAIHVAAHHAHMDAVALLVARGADINEPTEAGMTPLMVIAQRAIAARQDYYARCFQKALELGADVNAVDHSGRSVAHMAAARGDMELIKGLCQLPALDLTLADTFNNTPAMVAEANDYKQAAEYLRKMENPANRKRSSTAGLSRSRSGSNAGSGSDKEKKCIVC